jgi:hypothetical protein
LDRAEQALVILAQEDGDDGPTGASDPHDTVDRRTTTYAAHARNKVHQINSRNKQIDSTDGHLQPFK